MKIEMPIPDAKNAPPHPDEPPPGPSILQLDRFELGIKRHKDRPYAAADLLNLLLDVEKAYAKCANVPIVDVDALVSDKTTAEKRLGEGNCVLDADNIRFNADALISLLNEVVRLAERADPDSQKALSNFMAASQKSPEIQMQMARRRIDQRRCDITKTGEEYGLSREIAMFMADHLARPAAVFCSQRLAPLIQDADWNQGYCPICKNPPAMAFLSGDGGRRFLRCSLCRFVWNFQRLCCPFCDNRDPRELVVLNSPEEGDPLGLSACNKCGRYIKTFDFRKAALTDAVNLEVEDGASIYLDFAGGKEGYKRG